MLVKADSWLFYLGPSSKDDQQADLGSQAKAQARRAQVRKAQIQHRQRKANYTKQLEMDVAKLRDLIEETERESIALKRENEAIRRRFLIKNTSFDTTHHFPQASTATVYSDIPPPPPPKPAPDYTVSLISGFESPSTPVFQVHRTPTPSSWSSRSGSSRRQESIDAGASHRASPSSSPKKVRLSEAQTDHAINFILSLEHICWDHFNPSHYTHDDYNPEAEEHGHILMASAIALQSAGPGAWEQINAAKEFTRQQASVPSNSNPDPTAFPPQQAFTSTNQSHSHGHNHHHHSHRHNGNTNANTNVLATWHTPASENVGAGLGLTLESLHGLASTLNPADAELAPVQAWFEIARLYGGAAVVDAARMDRVRAELARSVECLHFGAVIQRPAFEGVLERVLGPAPVAEGEGDVEMAG
ncbi:hypothetical protein F4677DRAFT_399425 [Hypoxylon crocopeplum]|nr:hypothetical protein F4677DRAFT_399425 [Hypoxylon crocopeplum]